jgi:hypothetical protein
MNRTRVLMQDSALAGAVLTTGAALAFVPAWQGLLTEICRLAGVAAALVMGVLVVCRWVGAAGLALERATAALFLAGMPVVYVVRWLEVGGAGSGAAALGVELGGLVAFAALAVLGLKRSPWFLVGGIAAHGIAWDAWHWAFGSAFMFDWYAIGCLMCDLGLSLYLASRVSLHTARSGSRRARLVRPVSRSLANDDALSQHHAKGGP